jgi:hypothetical protein
MVRPGSCQDKKLTKGKNMRLKQKICVLGSILGLAAGETSVNAQLRGYEPIEVFGRGLAAQIEKEMQNHMQQFARSGVFGVTGDIKPSATVVYHSGGLQTVTLDGKEVPGASFTVEAIARWKLDVGGSFATYKWGAAETRQTIKIEIAPVSKNGKLVLSGKATLVSATATKERNAHQSQADDLRNRVTAILIPRLNERLQNIEF